MRSHGQVPPRPGPLAPIDSAGASRSALPSPPRPPSEPAPSPRCTAPTYPRRPATPPTAPRPAHLPEPPRQRPHLSGFPNHRHAKRPTASRPVQAPRQACPLSSESANTAIASIADRRTSLSCCAPSLRLARETPPRLRTPPEPGRGTPVTSHPALAHHLPPVPGARSPSIVGQVGHRDASQHDRGRQASPQAAQPLANEHSPRAARLCPPARSGSAPSKVNQPIPTTIASPSSTIALGTTTKLAKNLPTGGTFGSSNSDKKSLRFKASHDWSTTPILRYGDRFGNRRPSPRPVPYARMSGMKLLELTLPTPAENLALDEALLDQAEANESSCEVLRLWEPEAPMVVVGRSSKLSQEVKAEECQRRNIPVLRRSSGGTSIVAGPGCLMYAVILCLNERPELRAIDHAHRFVLDRIAAAIAPYVPHVRCRGTSDLVLDDSKKCPPTSPDGTCNPGLEKPPALKVSGNSVRVKRNWLLYHGTLLYNFPIDLIEACLPIPPRQPDYRAGPIPPTVRRQPTALTRRPAPGNDRRLASQRTFRGLAETTHNSTRRPTLRPRLLARRSVTDSNPHATCHECVQTNDTVTTENRHPRSSSRRTVLRRRR